MSKNREIAKAFGNCFDPPLTPVSVQRINGVQRHDAWMVATYDKDTSWGITAHAFSGKLHAYVEVQSDQAEAIGKLMAKWLTEAKRPNDETYA